jgi:hypothetical protein
VRYWSCNSQALLVPSSSCEIGVKRSAFPRTTQSHDSSSEDSCGDSAAAGNRCGCNTDVLLSDDDVIGVNLGLRSEWAHFLPFIECGGRFWVLF